MAWRSPPIVPGTRRISWITPPSARKIPPNSFGYESLDASRIIRSVLRRIAVGLWKGVIGSRLRELLLDALVEIVPEADEPRGSLAPRHPDGLRPRQRHFHLAIEHKETFLLFREADLDPPPLAAPWSSTRISTARILETGAV